MSKEIRWFPLLPALCSLPLHPLSQCITQPPTLWSGMAVCWWMLKAVLVPQQLTLLLQEVACQFDGISPTLLSVTQSRRGCRQMLHLYVFFTVFACGLEWAEVKGYWAHRKPLWALQWQFLNPVVTWCSKSVGVQGLKELSHREDMLHLRLYTSENIDSLYYYYYYY